MTLQEQIRQYRQAWASRGKWQDPDTGEAIMFALTELGEAADAYLRLKGGFVRNNDREAGRDKLLTELFDTVMMCIIAIDLEGGNLEQVAQDKLYLMDAKRQ